MEIEKTNKEKISCERIIWTNMLLFQKTYPSLTTHVVYALFSKEPSFYPSIIKCLPRITHIGEGMPVILLKTNIETKFSSILILCFTSVPKTICGFILSFNLFCKLCTF